jgi:hypothetical protein
VSNVKQCDMCKNLSELTPVGWFHVEMDQPFQTYDAASEWDFCSVQCLSLWSFKRRKK